MMSKLWFAFCCAAIAALFALFWAGVMLIFYKSGAIQIGVALFATSFWIMYQTGKHG